MATLRSRSTVRRNEKNANATSNKHYSPQKGRPSDALVERYEEYKRITKSLIAYFDSIAKQEAATAQNLIKSADDIPLPFRAGDQFIQDGNGWQDAFYAIRERSRTLADHHSNFSNVVETTVVEPLGRTRDECKEFAARIATELGKTADETDVEREASTKAIGQHSHGIGIIGVPSKKHVTAQDDPFITRSIVEKQLLQQIHQENRMTQAIISFQQSAHSFEKRVNESIRDACQAFSGAQKQMHERVREEWTRTCDVLQNVDAEAEWKHFTSTKQGKLLDPDTPLRDPAFLKFPYDDHPATKPLKQGYLERKSRIRKSYKEDLFVLTQAGFLHQYEAAHLSGSDPSKLTPALSLYLPECTLGPAAKESDKKHKFYIEGKRDVASGSDSHFKSFNFRKKDLQWTFKARSHTDMMAWWQAIDRVAKDSLTMTSTPSTAKEHQGEIVAAVQNVGMGQDQTQTSKKEGIQTAETTTDARVAAPEERKVADTGKEDKGEKGSVSSGETSGEESAGSSDEVDLVDADEGGGADQAVSAKDIELPGYVNTDQSIPPEKEGSLKVEATENDGNRASTSAASESLSDKKVDPAPETPTTTQQPQAA